MPRAKTPKFDPRARQRRQDTLVSYLDLEGDLDLVIEKLQGFKAAHPGYDSYSIDTDYGYYDERDKLKLIGHRLENDQEYAERMEILARQEELAREQKKTQRERDEADLQRLAKKLRKQVVDAPPRRVR